jgi:hypothetical protein
MADHIDELLVAYLADKILGDLRRHEPFPSDFYRAVNQFPMLSWLRQKIVPSDFRGLDYLWETGDEKAMHLFIPLLRPLHGNRGVREFLEKAWSSPLLPLAPRVAIQFELLAFDDISDPMIEEMHGFTMEYWDAWLEIAVVACGGSSRVLAWCQDRLLSKSIPGKKRWIYFCVAAGSDEPASAIALISSVEPQNRYESSSRERALEYLRTNGTRNR